MTAPAPSPRSGGLVGAMVVVALVGIGVTALTVLYMIASGRQTDFLVRLAVSAALAVPFAGLALVAALLLRRGRLVPLMWVAVGTSGLSVLTWWGLLWLEHVWPEEAIGYVAGAGFAFTVLSAMLVYTGGFLDLKTTSAVLRWLRWAVLAASWTFTAVLLAVVSLANALEALLSVGAMRALTVGIALLGAGSFLTSLAVWSSIRVDQGRSRRRAESLTSIARVALTCPGCDAEQSLSLGLTRCAACGLAMSIEIEEGRCACGYLLYRLDGDRCPECGREVETTAAASSPGPDDALMH